MRAAQLERARRAEATGDAALVRILQQLKEIVDHLRRRRSIAARLGQRRLVAPVIVARARVVHAAAATATAAARRPPSRAPHIALVARGNNNALRNAEIIFFLLGLRLTNTDFFGFRFRIRAKLCEQKSKIELCLLVHSTR